MSVYISQRLSLLLDIQDVLNLLLVTIVYQAVESRQKFLLQLYLLCNSINLSILLNFVFYLVRLFAFCKICCVLPTTFFFFQIKTR